MKLIGVGIADVKGSFLTRAIDDVVLSFAGIEGDAHAGLVARSTVRQRYLPRGVDIRNSRQLSLVSAEELAQTAGLLNVPSPLDWRAYGANLCFSQAPSLTTLAPGTRLVFDSGAIIVVDGENEPCTKTGKALSVSLGRDVRSAFVKAAMHRRGLVAWVERPGRVRVGDEPRIVPR
jgi:MOSC domain-containing protein YiiM